ncbi:uncharacterized protein LOC119738251 [Patiria miniata]|uniref:Uncharacterized protein n=1 Tax=Patiria miniata TaxID=46514 RepID=A0A914AZ81_PATMI|nr:uncharacterized protein LOC119738251 [Patiria miniata]
MADFMIAIYVAVAIAAVGTTIWICNKCRCLYCSNRTIICCLCPPEQVTVPQVYAEIETEMPASVRTAPGNEDATFLTATETKNVDPSAPAEEDKPPTYSEVSQGNQSVGIDPPSPTDASNSQQTADQPAISA